MFGEIIEREGACLKEGKFFSEAFGGTRRHTRGTRGAHGGTRGAHGGHTGHSGAGLFENLGKEGLLV